MARDGTLEASRLCAVCHDNVVERVVSLQRSRNPAADHAAEPVAIYALRPPNDLDPSEH